MIKKLYFIFVSFFLLLITLFISLEVFAMELTSPAFIDQGLLPEKFTCDGDGVSPPLSWKNAPGNTKSFALIADDPDASHGTWTHWVLYNIPATTFSLAENISKLPAGTSVGLNSWLKQKYGSPCPPSGEHRYFFKLYALDTILEFATPPISENLQKMMTGHIITNATIMGRYSRNR